MKAHPKLLSTPQEISQLAQSLSTRDLIAFDTEFIRETTFFPIVEIIQVATDEESWLVDAQAFNVDTLRPLLDVFESKKILKIVHAAQGDQECLYTTFGVVATPSMDTAVAASLCGYGDAIGLGNLLKSMLGVTIKKGHARTNWSVRPLPPQLIEYAHVDVEHLALLGRKFLEKLDKLGRREWAMELSAKWENKALYEPDPEGIALKLAKGGRLDTRGYAALIELLRWREMRVRQLNLPRRWVADDTVLLDLAHVRPKDLEHLAAFRGLNKGELKHSGEHIVSALKRASEAQDVKLPKMPRPDIPSGEESQALDLLSCYLGILADRHNISVKHLVTAPQLMPLFRAGALTGPQDLVSEGLLSAGAAHLIGDEVIAFLQGKRALSIQGSKVQIVEVK